MTQISEDHLEQLCLTWFQDAGWEYRYGPDLSPEGEVPERADYRQVLLPGRVAEALRRLNPNIPEQTLEEVLSRVAKPNQPSLLLNNRSFHEALLDGLPVEVEQAGEKRGDRVRLIDFETPERNRYLVVNQYTVQGIRQPRRPDLVCFINGLPIFAPELLLDYLRYFVLFEQSDGGIVKKIAAYHQFHAVRAAVTATVIASARPKDETASEERATWGKMVAPASSGTPRARARAFPWSVLRPS